MFIEFNANLKKIISFDPSRRSAILRALATTGEKLRKARFADLYSDDDSRLSYILYYGFIYALQMVTILCSDIVRNHLNSQPQKVFVHGSGFFPESYGLFHLFSLKGWDYKKTEFVLIERAPWRKYAKQLSPLPFTYHHKDFFEFNSYPKTLPSLYIFQNCVNEENSSNSYAIFRNKIYKLYDQIAPGSMIIITSVLSNNFTDLDSLFERIERDLKTSSAKILRSWNQQGAYWPQYDGPPSFGNLDILSSDRKNRFSLWLKNILVSSIIDKYGTDFIPLKTRCNFDLSLILKP